MFEFDFIGKTYLTFEFHSQLTKFEVNFSVRQSVVMIFGRYFIKKLCIFKQALVHKCKIRRNRASSILGVIRLRSRLQWQQIKQEGSTDETVKGHSRAILVEDL